LQKVLKKDGKYVECRTETGRKYYWDKKAQKSYWFKPGSDEDRLSKIMNKDIDGPPGANIVVLQVPQDWQEMNIYRHFSPFGELLSLRM